MTDEDVDALFARVSDAFLSGEADEVWCTYTRFFSPIRRYPTLVRLLPLTFEAGGSGLLATVAAATPPETEDSPERWFYEPDLSTILTEVLGVFLRLQIEDVLLESFASEQGARMITMEEATERADRSLQELTVAYNRLRRELDHHRPARRAVRQRAARGRGTRPAGRALRRRGDDGWAETGAAPPRDRHVARTSIDAALAEILEEIERESCEGVVYQVMGPVVDVAFKGEMPALGNLLRVEDRVRGLPLEAVQLLGGGLLRAIALDSTDCHAPRRRACTTCTSRSPCRSARASAAACSTCSATRSTAGDRSWRSSAVRSTVRRCRTRGSARSPTCSRRA